MSGRDRNFVKVGSVRVRWHRAGDGRTFVDARRYGRKLVTFRDHDEALREARRIAVEVNAGGVESTAMSAADRAAWAKIQQICAARGVDPIAAITEWDECRNLLPADASVDLRTAARVGAESLVAKVYTTQDVVAALLASKSGAAQDGRTARDLQTVLTDFAVALPGNIAMITPEQIEAWLVSRKKKDGSALSAKRFNHRRAIIVMLFKYARKRRWLPDVATAAQLVERQPLGSSVIGYFTPGEMIVILKHIEEEWMPWPLLVGFGGVRVEEVALGKHAAPRKDCLRWEDFDWEEGDIIIREEVAKNAVSRRIPMQENLRAFLSPWMKASGPVVPGGDKRGQLDNYRARFQTALSALAKQTDEITPRLVHWPQNALRHSYGSYRMAITKNVQQVSNEMGNSPGMIRKRYDNPRPRSQAKAWWSIFPADAERLSQLILRFEASA